MEAKEIKRRLMQKGYQICDVALELNCAPSHVSQVIHGNKKSIPVQKAVCRLMDTQYNEVWDGVEQGRTSSTGDTE